MMGRVFGAVLTLVFVLLTYLVIMEDRTPKVAQTFQLADGATCYTFYGRNGVTCR